MQEPIHQISDQLLALIKTESPFYTPDQLLEQGLPKYIVERMQLLMEDIVLGELSGFQSNWVQADDEQVEFAWKKYQSAIINAVIVPHSALEELLNTTITDILSVLVQPRKNMARYLFRKQETLTFSEIEKRCEQLTIYKHFGTAIPMYMKKRNLDELSVDRCEQLIRNLDSRIIANYTPKDWLKKLDALFTLFRGSLAPHLLNTFFEDKELLEIALLFEKIDHPINKEEFFDIITLKEVEPTIEETENIPETTEPSTPQIKISDSFKSEENQDEMLTILGDISEGGVIEVDNLEELNSLNALFGSSETDDDETDDSQIIPEDEDIENFRSNLTSILDQARHSFEDVVHEDEQENQEEKSPEQEEDITVDNTEDVNLPLSEEKKSLADNYQENNSQQVNDDNIEPDVEQTNDLEEITVDDDFDDNPLFEDEEEIEDDFDINVDADADETITEENEPENTDDETEDVAPTDEAEPQDNSETQPMWARFLTQEQMDVIIGESVDEAEESRKISFTLDTDALEEEEDEKPIASLFNERSESNEEPSQSKVLLEDFLEPNKKLWIKHIFSGKKKAYTEGIEEIMYFTEWKEASEYLETEIFNHHKVDMFAEETIEFIDALQTYFNEYKS